MALGVVKILKNTIFIIKLENNILSIWCMIRMKVYETMIISYIPTDFNKL